MRGRPYLTRGASYEMQWHAAGANRKFIVTLPSPPSLSLLGERGASPRREINAVSRGTSEFDAERGNSIIRRPSAPGTRPGDPRMRQMSLPARARARATNGASRDSIAVIKFMANSEFRRNDAAPPPRRGAQMASLSAIAAS